jgi:hypothetical protein
MSAPVDLPFDIVGDSDRLLSRLMYLRDRLVLKAEEVSIKLEGNMNPGVAASLSGDDQKKARHLFESQARKIEAELNKLMVLAENFRTHIH